jgi:hypothetical protein
MILCRSYKAHSQGQGWTRKGKGSNVKAYDYHTKAAQAQPPNHSFASFMLEIKSVVLHFQGNAFNSDHLLVYQLVDVGGSINW